MGRGEVLMHIKSLMLKLAQKTHCQSADQRAGTKGGEGVQ